MAYRDPEQRKQHDKEYRDANRDKVNEWGRNYNQNPKRIEKRKANYAKIKNDPEKWAEKLEKDRKRGRLYRSEKRMELIDMLGGKCVRCGFTDPRALQFDHINGGGTQERITRGSMNGYYNDILKSGGEGYQLLCANCNQIKRFEEGEGYILER